MKVITNNDEILNVKEIRVISNDNSADILFPTQIKSILFEDEDKILKDYEIKRINNLSLCYKAFIGRTANKDEIAICLCDKELRSKWTIASFEPHYDGDHLEGYSLESCGDRLNDKEINWTDFGKLVQFGYNYLNNLLKEDE